MGANCSTVTSIVSLSRTMLPAFTVTAPARPLIGETTSVKRICSWVSARRARSALVVPAAASTDGLVGAQGCLGGVAGGDQLIDALSGDYAERSELPGDVGLRLALLLCGCVARNNRAGLLLHCGVAFEVGLLFQRLSLQRLMIDAEE